MKILVTGSSGHVGSRLVQALQKRGHKVEEFDFAQGCDVLDSGAVKKAVHNKDAVYHLAAILDEHSPNLFRVNIEGTRNVLGASAKEKVSHFIFLGSVGVMGDISGKADEDTKYSPKTPYERSKAEAEDLVLSFQDVLPVTVVRSALVLGANSYWKDIIAMVSRGFPVIGSGKQRWQTIYTDDLVGALVFVLGKKAAFGERLVVAGKDAPTLNEVYALIQKELGIKQEVRHMPVFLARVMGLLYSLIGRQGILTQAHIDRLLRTRYYSTLKIERLGWKPKYGTKEALAKVVAELV